MEGAGKGGPSDDVEEIDKEWLFDRAWRMVFLKEFFEIVNYVKKKHLQIWQMHALQ